MMPPPLPKMNMPTPAGIP
jgi:hypothetical protein